MLVDFLVSWAVITVLIKIYLMKKDIDIKINNDIIALILALIISGFLTIMQAIGVYLIHFVI